MLSGQDWEPVVFRKKTTPGDAKSKEAVKAAQRAGAEVHTLAKDKQREDRDRMRKLEQDLDPSADAPPKAALQKLSLAMRKSMIEARTKKGINQVQLANMLNVRTQVIQDLETGKVVNDKGILQKLRNVLGVSLRFGE
jgi:ribosome-binding protein aMBF1 (putative translation factor)